jgi:sugar phosphate permease
MEPCDQQTFSKTLRYRWLIFWILSIQYLFSYFHRVAPAVVVQELSLAFNISATSLGVLASAYLYPYAMAQLPVGILSDSLGPRKTITIFGLITAVGTIIFGLSPYFSTALVGRVLIGLGNAAVFIGAMTVFAQWFRAAEYARISGTLMSVGGLGWFLATTPLAFLAQTIGWRFSFVAIGVVTLGLTVLTWFFVVDKPQERGLPVIAGPTSTPKASRNTLLNDLTIILKTRHFWSIAVWFIFRGSVLFGFFGLWGGPYLMDIYGLSKAGAGGVLAMVAVAMVVTSPLIGHLSDKTFASRKVVLVGSSVLNVLCWFPMLFFPYTLPVWVLYVLFFLLGATFSPVGALAVTTTKEYFPHRIAGTSMGTMNGFPFLGGLIFQPFMGYILDLGGKIGNAYSPSAYRMMIFICFLTSVLALASISFCRETLRGKL